jgi:hypothetical protein
MGSESYEGTTSYSALARYRCTTLCAAPGHSRTWSLSQPWGLKGPLPGHTVVSDGGPPAVGLPMLIW